MIKRSMVVLFFLMITFSLPAQSQPSQEEFFKRLYTQGLMSLTGAKKKCEILSQKNRQLADAMAEIYKTAQEKRNPSAKTLAETDYLLGFLQERIEDVCGRLNLANEETVKIIVSTEAGVLFEKMKESKDFPDYVDKIFGTEYSKFLYLTATPESLEKMHTKWALTMSSQRKNIAQMLNHIKKGNKILREELTNFTKTFKVYYEDAAGIFDEKKKKTETSGQGNAKK